MSLKLSIGFGTPPYDGTVKNFNGTTVHVISNVYDDEIEIPDNVSNAFVGGFEAFITDSTGKSGSTRYDNGTLRPMKVWGCGYSVPNGNTQNHYDKIMDGEAAHFPYTGIIFPSSDIQNDAQLAYFAGLSPFNSTIALPNPPAFGLDRTIHAARSNTYCKFLRVNIWYGREEDKLNNGSDRTQFFSMSDAMMRPDGVTPVTRAVGQIGNVINPSYAAEATFQYACRIAVPFFKRYLMDINYGTIMGIGSVMTSNGEGEMEFNYKAGGDIETVFGTIRTHGDFHPESMAKFFALFPEYIGTSNNDIALAARESDLGAKWSYHCNQMIINFEDRLTDYIDANVPGITRVKYRQVDSGSMTDELAFWRRTLNSEERATHPRNFLYKANDNSVESPDTVHFYLDQLASLARKAGGIAIAEPSPTLPYEEPEKLAFTSTEMTMAFNKRVWISFFTNQVPVVNNLVSSSGVQPGSTPKPVLIYKNIDGHKRLVKHTVNLSEVLKQGGYGGTQFWKNSMLAFKSANGLTAVDTHTIDDLNPTGGNEPIFTGITNYLNSNLGSYLGNVLFDIKKSSSTPVYSYTQGSYSRSSQVSVMSLSKAVTAATILTLIEDGLLTPDTTIGSVLTDWTGSKGAVKLKEIMNHTSGLPDNQTNEGEPKLEDWAVWYRNQIGSTTITPGVFEYRTVPWQIAARMAEVVTGKRWKVLWKERIGTPCNMGGAEYNPFFAGPPAQDPDNPHAGYGLYCTQSEFLNFMEMIRNNGNFNGNSVIASGTLAQFWTPQNGSTQWGFGMIRNDGGNEPTAESQKGCYAWINRSLGYCAVLFTQSEYNNTLAANNGLRELVRSNMNSV